MKIKFLDLLNQPITNSYIDKINNKNIKDEFFYNLSIGFNKKNYLVSLLNPINPKRQYTDKYAHRASQSITMNESFKTIALKLKKKFKPKLSLEIGSNDGVFLKNFNKDQIIAVEPCLNLARITRNKGYYTYGNFWNKHLIKKILKKKNKVDLIYSANTISHIPNLKETFDAIYIALSDNGVFVFEDPYIGSVVKMNSYDQFYDEHVHLFSLLAISKLVKDSNLKVFDVELLNTHGGSLRYYVSKNISKHKETERIKNFKKREIKQGLHKYNTYKKFSNRVKKSKNNLLKLLK